MEKKSWFEGWDRRRPLSLADLLNEIETTKNIQDIPDNVVIFPPDNVNDPVTDEDSGEKENVVMYNLPGSQLRAESEFSNYDQQWDSDNEKPLSSFVKRKPKKIKKFSFSKRDLQSNLKHGYRFEPAPKDAHEYLCYDKLDHLVVYLEQQRRCAVCHKKASYICHKCSVSLHAKDCFYNYLLSNVTA
nr:unnamed protein product [Callosobruchus chinensis]